MQQHRASVPLRRRRATLCFVSGLARGKWASQAVLERGYNRVRCGLARRPGVAGCNARRAGAWRRRAAPHLVHRTSMAKRDHAGANNTCRQCGLTNKARDGHMPREGPFAAMRACGWCPERQEFSVRSASSDKRGAGLRLRLLEQHLLTVDSEGAVRYDPAACVHHDPAQQQQLESEMREAVAFVEDVRAGRPREVASRLRARPELVLAPVLRERPPLDRLGRRC